jgi:hypothetical protein
LWRWCLQTLLAVLALALVTALATLRPIDRSAWLENEAAKSALAAAAETHRGLSQAKAAPLEAGWTSVPLELRIGEPLAGYGARRGAASVGVEEPLFARALALRAGSNEVVLVAADVLLVHREVAREVAARCAAKGISEKAIYFTATHTHCGPGGWGPNTIEQAVCGKFDRDAVERLSRVLTRAIVEARASLRRAEWTWLELSAPGHVRNRTVKDGPIDPALDALCVRRADDGALGAMVFYGAHATCLGSRVMKFAGDYPGAVVRQLMKEGVAFAAFGAGAVASQSPVGNGNDSARAESIGADLAREVASSIRSAKWRGEIALGAARFDVALPRLQVRIGQRVRLAAWLTGSLHAPIAPVHFVRCDERWLVGLPVEFSAMLSAPLRADAARAGIGVLATPFNGDYAGYVLPPKIDDTSCYEAGMNFLGPWAGEYFAELVAVGAGVTRGTNGAASGAR